MAFRAAQISLALASVAFAAPIAQPADNGDGSSSPSKGGKAGIAYNDASAANNFPGLSWAYNWNAKPNGLSKDKSYVPMLHDSGADRLSQWAADSAGAEYCLSFNEPDQSQGVGGCSLSPEQAASLYKSNYQKGGCKKLGAPAVSSQEGANTGLNWLKSFLSACSDCQVDFAPVHWYGAPGQNQAFKDFVKRVHDTTGKPVWVTEYGLYQGSGSDSQKADFYSDVTKWLNGQDYVQRFSPMKGGDASTELTPNSAVGKAYSGAI